MCNAYPIKTATLYNQSKSYAQEGASGAADAGIERYFKAATSYSLPHPPAMRAVARQRSASIALNDCQLYRLRLIVTKLWLVVELRSAL